MSILFSTVDLEVVNKPIFTRSENNKWTRAKQVIGKGGYLWYLGRGGILLGDELIIGFKEPIRNFRRDDRPVYLVNLSISPEESAGILVKFAGQVIQLK